MKPLKTSPFQTVLTIVVGFMVFFLLSKNIYFLYFALLVGLAGVFSSFLAEKIHFLWMKLTWVLSLIVPNILLTTIFYVFLFPIATASKIFGNNDPLDLKNSKESLFKDVNKDFSKESFEKVW